MDDIVLRLRGVSKWFGEIVANDNISLELARGEVLALLGENGAGKSTLVSILFGHYAPDRGSISVFGRTLPPGKPSAALEAGIGMVHQHFSLADNLTVLDNVLLGTEPLTGMVSLRKAAATKLKQLAERFGLAVDPDARVGTLAVGAKQRVEILKSLYRGARILILDEPTSVLAPQEVQSLFATLRRLVADGMSVIFISHKLDEVLAISDRIAVLRGGELVAQVVPASTSKTDLAQLMIGHAVRMPTRQAVHRTGEVLVQLKRVSSAVRDGRVNLREVDLEVQAGEIVAIAGVAGNGQDLLADLLSGLLAPSAGALRLAGKALAAKPEEWVKAGVGRVPEDRQGVGVVGDMAVWENVILERYRDSRFCTFGLINRRAARAHAWQLAEHYDVRLAGIDAPMRALSGGNIQKVILGRVLTDIPSVVIANQPTWGLDVGAVSFVHAELLAARARAAAIVLLSEDLDEVFALADRIAVMHQGELTPARPAAQWSLPEIGMAMAGALALRAH